MATELRHNRRVVVKALSPDLVSPARTARFKREIELTVRLQHPLILPVLTSGAYQDVLYYIAPFIAGESLKDRIARDEKLPLGDIVKILRDVAEALAFAHAQGVVHRDVKPGNILSRRRARHSRGFRNCARADARWHTADRQWRVCRDSGVHGARAADGSVGGRVCSRRCGV